MKKDKKISSIVYQSNVRNQLTTIELSLKAINTSFT
ncbi:hypothetical protein F383_11453 [Gossypium arboreum]|uniref:Uncharacterized protein n=1 Tax=Gossypium arboreum TaxID=29729 RepID=A0A0B0ND35_GOSAR|nr:hypothetical protein F383_11453 [Gossypium arboreum]